jgi:UDP-3-O-[3-hydroxymyristoyl] glucosamine N-acyltransferase
VKVSYTLRELATLLDVPLEGDGTLRIDGLASLESAGAGKLSFLSNPRYKHQLAGCNASAIIIHPELASSTDMACLISRSPYECYARASQIFAAQLDAERCSLNATDQSRIHASAVVSSTALIADDVVIGPYAVIESGVSVGAGSRIGAACFVGNGSSIGQSCILYPNVNIYHEVSIGDRVILHSGAVIGADGFGFAFDGQRSVKIAQLGSVKIGSDVEIGAGSTVDRGALDDTVIEEGVKIDNQVQIAHNCIVGAHTVICGCSALAGSTRIGKYCVLGGGVGVTGHLSITDKVTVSAMTMVTHSISKPGVYSSGTLMQESGQWKRNAVTLGKLAEISRKVRNLEKQLQHGSTPESGKKL